MEENICAKCAKIYSTCCSLKKNKNNLLFPLTKKEIANITSYTKNNLFLEKKQNSSLLLFQLTKLFPTNKKNIFSIFKLKDNLDTYETNKKNFKFYHFTLKLKKDRCYFLSNTGCVLPKQIRPYFCQIYPFWINNGKIITFNDEECLALKKYNKISELLKLFNISYQKIFFLYESYKKNLLNLR